MPRNRRNYSAAATILIGHLIVTVPIVMLGYAGYRVALAANRVIVSSATALAVVTVAWSWWTVAGSAWLRWARAHVSDTATLAREAARHHLVWSRARVAADGER